MNTTLESDQAELAQKTTTAPTRLISKHEVLHRVGVSYPTIWLWMRERKFPRSRELGGKVCWVENEIEEWMTSLPVRRLKGDGA